MSRCSVKGCPVKFAKGIKLFKIPKNPFLRAKWEEYLLANGHDRRFATFLRICSNHFDKTAIEDGKNRIPTVPKEIWSKLVVKTEITSNPQCQLIRLEDPEKISIVDDDGIPFGVSCRFCMAEKFKIKTFKKISIQIAKTFEEITNIKVKNHKKFNKINSNLFHLLVVRFSKVFKLHVRLL